MRDRSLSRAIVQRAVQVAVVAAMWVLVVGGTTTFAFFFIMTPTRWFYVNAHNFIAWRNGLVLQYNFVNATTGKATPLLPNINSFILIWQWCGTLAAALGSAGLLWAYGSSSMKPAADLTTEHPAAGAACAAAARNKAVRRSRRPVATCVAKAASRVRRLLRWQLPPRGLWRAVLGPDGLSLLDLILILLWFGLHIMWLTDMTFRVLDTRRMPAATKAVTIKSNTTTAITANSTSTTALNSTRASPLPAANTSSAAAVNATRAAAARLRSLLAANSTNSNAGNSSSVKSASNGTSTTNAKTTTTTTVKPLPREVQGSLAKYAGFVGNLDLLLLFFPLPRCNFLHWLLNSDFPAMVKYHRWLGHGTLLMYSLHAVIYMAIWKADGTFSANMQWAMGSYVNNVAGLIALISGWVLWITSMPYIRRHFFNLFYSCHITGTVVFMLFAFMHRKDIMGWVLPGVFLYLLDCVLRTLQQAFNWTRVSAAATAAPGAAAVACLSPHNSVLTLTIQCDKSLSWAGLDIVFLNAPEISWWQWHPFTLATSSAGGDTKMVFHIKTYSHWTQRLVSRLATDATPLKLYVSGPYHGAHRKWITNFDRHIFVAGGIGVTPPLGMLQDLIARRKAVAAATGCHPPGRVSLIWISRSRDELGTLPYDILQEAARTGPDAWLNLQLYLTGHDEDEEQEQTDAGRVPRSGHSSGSSTGLTIPVNCLTTTGANTTSGDQKSSVAADRASPPLSHDYMFSPLLWAAAVVLCFGGGFAGFICAQAYEAHISRTVAVRKDYTHVGMLQFAALGLGASLPPALLMLAAHLLIRSWKSRRSAAAESPSQHQQQCTLYDKDSCCALAPAACRTASALHARMSVASTAAFTDDAALEPSGQGDGTGGKPGAAAGNGPSITGSQPDISSCRSNCLTGAEPYIRHCRPDLAALFEEVARTGGGPPAEVTRRRSALIPGEAGGRSSSAAAVAAAPTTPSGANPEQISSLDLGSDLDQQGEGHQDLDLDPSDLRVAVFVAGPVRLVEAVEETCARLNGVWGRAGRAYLEAHPLTHEL
ncbi:hypothetical protein PLESTB_001568000 [Pleodorina starrii]|uniref:FAD-binding FR-type domain-containing protein n=1 Tax=Pleodorina starrii TaxID=330485 RepID=A0A9W6BYV4_9CHLO|nr:hypothetical protein PLESTB_001568000 [Pleodorina starrii]GLC72723.1 hypothetical protein PLESTF_001286200 [Pleodorina starrii]